MSHDLDDLPPAPPPPPQALAVRVAAGPTNETPADDATFSAPQRLCPNCGAPVHGPYCYACGQSEKGMVRNLSEVFSDLSDILFNVDSRIFRSLFDLYFRPGYLTTEYIDGRRARYVTPFRLFFVLSVLAFFAMQSVIDFSGGDGVFAGVDKVVEVRARIGAANTTAEVDQALADGTEGVRAVMAQTGITAQTREQLEEATADLADEARSRKLELARLAVDNGTAPAEIDAAVTQGLADLRAGVLVDDLSVKAKRKLEEKEEKLRKRGEDRKRELAEAGTSTAAAEPTVYSCGKRNLTLFAFNGKPWHREANPVAIDWLPDAANARLNNTLQHMCENFDAWMGDIPKGFRATFSVLPQTLFVLMPLFALMLKVFYLFKRRLYMEHLLVALHSHAFLFLSIIVVLTLGWLKSWAEGIAWITAPIGWLELFAWLWMLVYLFWMQKRVYRQGWVMTTLKFSVIGICYTFLLALGAIFAIMFSLAVT